VSERRLENDWYPGTIPDNVVIDPTANIETSYSFARFKSELPIGATISRGVSIFASTLDVGPKGRIVIDECALIGSAYILCDCEVRIGPYALIAWNAVVMDHYRGLSECQKKRTNTAGKCETNTVNQITAPRPVSLGRNTWVGFEACILPGVSVGEGSIVGARSVVTSDVPPFVLVAGNPARIVRELQTHQY